LSFPTFAAQTHQPEHFYSLTKPYTIQEQLTAPSSQAFEDQRIAFDKNNLSLYKKK
jgi:hypothetical protein